MSFKSYFEGREVKLSNAERVNVAVCPFATQEEVEELLEREMNCYWSEGLHYLKVECGRSERTLCR